MRAAGSIGTGIPVHFVSGTPGHAVHCEAGAREGASARTRRSAHPCSRRAIARTTPARNETSNLTVTARERLKGYSAGMLRRVSDSDAHPPHLPAAPAPVIDGATIVVDTASGERMTADAWVAQAMTDQKRQRDECVDALMNAIARGDLTTGDAST
jgi:hypothetical protein